jgi:hypothetical protein
MRVYIGTTDGGVWLSTDGALTWMPLLDQQVSPTYTSGAGADVQSIGSIAVRFGTPNDLVFVGTGDGAGIGVLSSSTSGAPGSWTQEATNLIGRRIYRIAIDPDDPTKVFVATDSGLFRRPAAPPYTTWTFVFGPGGPATDLVIAGSGVNKKYYAAFAGNQVYVSTDFSTWNPVPGYSAVGTSRIALAAGESDPTVIYALADDASLHRLTSSTFQNVTNVPAAALFSEGQGVFDIVVAVDPNDANTIYMAGDATGVDASFYKGKLTGGPGTWAFPFNPANTANPSADPTWIGLGIHPDVHTLAFANTAVTTHDGQNVLLGCDGGLFQSVGVVAAKGTFVARNLGLNTVLVNRLAQRPDTDAVVFGGQMDNGIFRLWGEQAGFHVQGGDGGGCAVDPNDPYQFMCLVEGGSGTVLIRSNDGAVATWFTGNFPPTGDPNEGRQAFMGSMIAVSPAGVVPTLAAFGTNRLWVTNAWGNPGSWTTLPTNTNPYSPGPPNYTQDALDGVVTTIGIASATRIFVSTIKSVYRFDFSGGSWGPNPPTPISMTGTPATRWIGAIAVDDPAAGSLYMTLNGNGYDHVWYFNGATWTSAGLSKAVLDVPALAVVVDPNNPATPTPATPQFVYVGTQVGVWKGTRTGASAWSWALFSQGLPEAAVSDLAIHERTRLLRAALSGRSVWEIPLDALSAPDPDIYLRVNYADTGRVIGGARYPWVDGAPDPTAKGFNVYHWMSADIKVRRGSLGGLPPLAAQPGYLDFAFNIGDWIDSTTHIETADQSGMDRVFVEVHNRGLTPLPAGQVRICLLLTTVGAAGLPPLPTNYATFINNGDITNWVAGSQWHFADPTMKYRVTTGVLDVRTPQVVEFDIDFSLVGLSPGDHVCAAAFITTVGGQDQLTASNTNLDQLTMQDKHVAHRNLHLVMGGIKPIPEPRGGGFLQEPQTFLIDFHNIATNPALVDLVFQRPNFPGEMAVVLPSIQEKAAPGWTIVHHDHMETSLREHLGAFLERLGECVEHAGDEIERLGAEVAREPFIEDDVAEAKRRRVAKLDRSRVFVAGPGTPTIQGVTLPANSFITAAVTVRAPAGAKPGDRSRFDILQKRGAQLLGGSSYVFVVDRPK